MGTSQYNCCAGSHSRTCISVDRSFISKPKSRRFPLGDSIGQPGPDGLLDPDFDFELFVPEGQSFWEIDTGLKASVKASSDYDDLVKMLEFPEARAFRFNYCMFMIREAILASMGTVKGSAVVSKAPCLEKWWLNEVKPEEGEESLAKYRVQAALFLPRNFRNRYHSWYGTFHERP